MTPAQSRPNGVRVITRENVNEQRQGELFELPPRVTARVTLAERWRVSGSRFGDLSASHLTQIRNRLMRGEPDDWVDLCEFWLASDPDLASLYGTRLDRIMDREWEVVPNEFGDPRLASLAAELVHESIGRIENWNYALRKLAHAIAVGFSAAEMQWEYDRATKRFYVKNVLDRHGHRFRYGTSWDLRFYDKGQRPGADGYGEHLREGGWITLFHSEQGGYPCTNGVMLACSYHNAFARWVEKMRIGHVEKYGSATPSYKCPPDTPEETRHEIRDRLQDMTNDGVFVYEHDGELELIAAGGGGASGSAHKETLDDYYRQRARLWLGTSDAADPGKHGTQGAVGERVDATTDPKTVGDCKNIAQALHLSLCKYLIRYNAKALGAPVNSIPIPKLKAWKTEEDIAEQQAQQQQSQRQPGMMPNGMPAPRIPEITLARDHDPKAAASGEPRRVRRVIGRAATRSPMPSTSLTTRAARAARGE